MPHNQNDPVREVRRSNKWAKTIAKQVGFYMTRGNVQSKLVDSVPKENRGHGHQWYTEEHWVFTEEKTLPVESHAGSAVGKDT